MKPNERKIYLVALLGITIFIGCKKDVEINNTPVSKELISYSTDTTFSDLENLLTQTKVVLIQEFTGVYCYTCPHAHDTVKKILLKYPNQIAAMNIHSHLFNLYDDPNVMGNLYDFRTVDGDTVVSMLGGIISLPSAAVNMKTMPQESKILSYKREKWTVYADAEIIKEPQVNIQIATDYNSSTRVLKVVTRYHILESLGEAIYHSIGLVENNILDKQYKDTAVVNDYVHQHIFRDMITNAKGDLLTDNSAKGIVTIKVNYYTVPSQWNKDNLEVISYVHKRNSAWDVFQSAIKNIR